MRPPNVLRVPKWEQDPYSLGCEPTIETCVVSGEYEGGFENQNEQMLLPFDPPKKKARAA